MINLCGVAISNYYNKIKLVLLEKGIEFKEEFVPPSQDESLLKRSPLGKIPFIETESGCLSESQVILEYLEELYPEKPLYPADVYQKAKCRELTQHIELNIELHARRLYQQAFFGKPVSEDTQAEVRQQVEKGLKGLARLAQFSPFIAGESFTASDCVAWTHFFMVGMATQKIYGQNLVTEIIPEASEYIQLLETRASFQQVVEARNQALAQLLSK